MAKYNINKISEIQSRNVFVDANILIYWNWEIAGKEEKASNYSSIYQKLIEQNNELFTDFLVISEVENRMIKIEYEAKIKREQRNNPDFALKYKQYRDSDEGQQKLNDIYITIKNQVENLNIIGKSFSKNDIMNFLSVNNLDFNDKGILKICQENNFVLLTDDGDYKNSNVDILTCNRYILN